mmetsp:Transcript_23415/g.38604  ORF Transcript_23415/g.38604 Transcript_23415/m.38604 type:complete len:235 (+) Transcript_23415:826-1530(+)
MMRIRESCYDKKKKRGGDWLERVIQDWSSGVMGVIHCMLDKKFWRWIIWIVVFHSRVLVEVGVERVYYQDFQGLMGICMLVKRHGFVLRQRRSWRVLLLLLLIRLWKRIRLQKMMREKRRKPATTMTMMMMMMKSHPPLNRGEPSSNVSDQSNHDLHPVPPPSPVLPTVTLHWPYVNVTSNVLVLPKLLPILIPRVKRQNGSRVRMIWPRIIVVLLLVVVRGVVAEEEEEDDVE